MKLKSLEVKDIASYKYCKINFEKISYPLFITGKTGSGKTTFFVDAIIAALFGAPYGTKTLLKAFVAEGKSRGEIKLEFEVDGETYVIRRIIRRNSQSDVALLDHKGRVLATGKIAETKLRRLIGMDEKTLIATLVVRQGEVQNLITARPSELRSIFARMLNLEFFNKLRDKVKDMRARVNSEISGLNGELRELQRQVNKEKVIKEERQRIQANIKSLEEKLESLNKEKKELEEKRNELNRIVGELIGRINALENRVKELERTLDEKKRIEKEIELISSEVEKFGEEKIQKAGEYIGKLSEYYKLEKEVNLLRTETERMEKDLKIISELEALERKLTELKDVEEKLEEKKVERETLKLEITKIEAKLSEIDEHIEALKKAEARCPVCGALLTEDRKKERIGELSKEKEELRSKLIELNRRYKELEKEISNLEKAKRTVIKLEERIRTLKESVNRWDVTEDILRKKRNELQNMDEKMKQIKQEILSFTGMQKLHDAEAILNMLNKLRNKLAELNALEERLVEISKRIKEMEETIKEIISLKKEYERANSELNAVEDDLRKIENEIEKTSEEINKLKGRLHEIDKILKEIQENKAKIEEIKRRIAELKIKDEAYSILETAFAESGFPLHLLENFLTLVENYTNEYLSSFGMNIEVEIKRDKRGSGINLIIYSEGKSRDKKTFSGGEQTIIGFALRLGISRALVDYFARGRIPKFLIIDEGFGPLDEDLRKKVVDALYALYSSGEFEQMIVISHQSELRNSHFFRSVFEVRKERGISYLFNENGEMLCEMEK